MVRLWRSTCEVHIDHSSPSLIPNIPFRFDPDPLLSFSIPKDGDYTIEVRDILYRGRPEFIYRMTLGAFPYVTHVFPLGGQRNTPVALELHGINLSTNFLVPGDSPAVRTVGLSGNQPALNTLPFAVGDTPEFREAEPNDTPAQANRVTTPVTINGRTGFVLSDGVIPAGQDQARLTLTAPADAQPGSLAAPIIVGTAAIGNGPVVRQVTGAESVMQAFSLTHIVPTKEFVVAVLRAPPFTLLLGIPPKEIQVHQGSNVPVVVKVARREGIKGSVSLEAVAPPAGVTIKPETIPADKGEVTITLNVSKQAPLGLRQTVIINGTLKTDKETTTHAAPALPIKIIGP
jgi:hypothetical protein